MITAEQAKELLAAATPGPWQSRLRSDYLPDSSVEAPCPCCGSIADGAYRWDTPLLAAAPDLAQAVIDLTERAEKAEAKIAAVEVLTNEGAAVRSSQIRAALGGEQP